MHTLVAGNGEPLEGSAKFRPHVPPQFVGYASRSGRDASRNKGLAVAKIGDWLVLL